MTVLTTVMNLSAGTWEVKMIRGFADRQLHDFDASPRRERCIVKQATSGITVDICYCTSDLCNTGEFHTTHFFPLKSIINVKNTVFYQHLTLSLRLATIRHRSSAVGD